MSFEVPAIPRRVKVYELLNESWHDRGTGFCIGDIISDDAYILVKGEDDEEKYLLETKIFKDVQYQKQQDTLIVWTDPDETDLALSFQESDGCTAVWEFITDVQRNLGLDDIASDDINDNFGSGSIALPAEPTLTNLSEVEKCLTIASHCQYGRGPVLRDLIEYDYIGKLVPLLAMAEDLESITDLHALCRIMKLIILMNDNTIMEQIVLEEYIIGVVGILEYDPEFPSFKANHRDYISDESRFKEVVPISDEEVRNKIKYTFRLQYLKDVVLARLLDDPTFSMLSSMIFFHQVAILNNLQHNEEFINALFNIFDDDLNNASQISGDSQAPVIEAPSHGTTVEKLQETGDESSAVTNGSNPANADSRISKKRDAVRFIHQFCLTAKNLQASQRASLYSSFIKKRLFAVIDFALRDISPSIRSSGTELILALIDHDPSLVRNVVLENDNQKQTAIVDTLIDILLSEPDFGITSQVAEALQILLDPTSGQPYDVFRKTNDFMVRQRADDPEIEMFLDSFYGPPVERLFRKLSDLHLGDISTISVARASFFSCLCELVSAFIRLHGYRSRTFLIESNVLLNIGKLFSSSHKSLRLVALRCFRQCLGTNDEFYFRFLVKNKLFGPVVELLADLGDKNNLLSSACLEFFEFIRVGSQKSELQRNMKSVVTHVVNSYRDDLENMRSLDTISLLIARSDEIEDENNRAAVETAGDMKATSNRGRWGNLRDLELDEDEYFNTSDDETRVDDDLRESGTVSTKRKLEELDQESEILTQSPISDSESSLDTTQSGEVSESCVVSAESLAGAATTETEQGRSPPSTSTEDAADDISGTTSEVPPLTPLGEKRRRHEERLEEDDEIVKLALKRKKAVPLSKNLSKGIVNGTSNSGKKGLFAKATGKFNFKFGNNKD